MKRMMLIGSALAVYAMALAGLTWLSGNDIARAALGPVIVIIPLALAYVIGRKP